MEVRFRRPTRSLRSHWGRRGDPAHRPEVANAMKARLEAAKASFAPFRHKDILPAFKALQAQIAHPQD